MTNYTYNITEKTPGHYSIAPGVSITTETAFNCPGMYEALEKLGWPMTPIWDKLDVRAHDDDDTGRLVLRIFNRRIELDSRVDKVEAVTWALEISEKLHVIMKNDLATDDQLYAALPHGARGLPMRIFHYLLATMTDDEKRVVVGFIQRRIKYVGMN